MKQTFEYYVVDPGTWKDKQKLNNIISSTIDWDQASETLGSASIDSIDSLGECYVRTYMVVVQNGLTTKIPLGTHLVQTPSVTYDGTKHEVTNDAYTPLLELKEKTPPVGYTITKNEDIIKMAYKLVRENMRAPIFLTIGSKTLDEDFIADTDDTWLTLIRDLIAKDKCRLDLDEMGRVVFAPIQETEAMRPVWTYNDDNSSILYPEITMDRDLYGIPNVVEVIFSRDSKVLYSVAENNNSSSPVSIKNRGRRIVHRVTDPEIPGLPNQKNLDEYARLVLDQMSTLEYTVSYSHGYCGTRIGDCVRLNYKRAGINDIKAKIITQSITCNTGCMVDETAVFTSKLLEMR